MEEILKLGVTGAAVLTTLLSVVVSIFLSKTTEKHARTLPIDYKTTDDPNKESRLNEVRDELERQDNIAKWNSRADGLLIFGQYIIGGVLASSFVQQSLSGSTIGFLGILVLFSSLVRQRFRSDIRAQNGRRRIRQLRQLIRETEDDLYALKTNQECAISMYEIRTKVTARLSGIENEEIAELEKESNEADHA